MPNCPQHHPMWAAAAKSEWICDVCKSQHPIGEVCFSCRKCNFDVCNSCIPSYDVQPQSQHGNGAVRPQQYNVRCPAGHALTGAPMPSEWNCDTCSSGHRLGETSYGCRTCNFDMCEACVRKSSAPSQPAGPPAAAPASPATPASPASPGRKGKTRALFIGINYVGTENQLSGCVNDVRNIKGLLEHIQTDLSDSRFLVDDPQFPGCFGKPTRKNIEQAVLWLADGAQPGDNLFFHYSGHGSQLPDDNGDEDDGFDETLVPLDFNASGMIRDDWIFKSLCASLPAGCRLTAVTDCCHSGSILDLPFELQGNTFARVGKKETQADVLLISGCKDSQTSADVSSVGSFFNGQGPAGAGGACTSCLMAMLEEGRIGKVSYGELRDRMLKFLREHRYTQVPQFSSSKPFSLQGPFSFTGSLL